MDNLCHTLVGAALAETGLQRRTPLATAALVIGANLPGVDVLSYAWGPDVALGFRRGWTHGVLALAVWPFLLTGLLLVWDRLIRRRRHPDAGPADPKALLLLSAIALLFYRVEQEPDGRTRCRSWMPATRYVRGGGLGAWWWR
jgi:inner membrane protein